MHCNQLRDPNTGELLAIVCGDRNRVPLCACGKSSRFQCDWKIAPGDESTAVTGGGSSI